MAWGNPLETIHVHVLDRLKCQECLPFIQEEGTVQSIPMRTNRGVRASQEEQTPNPEHVKKECRRADLLPLVRLLVRQPPKEHDFRTCPICRRCNITEI